MLSYEKSKKLAVRPPDETREEDNKLTMIVRYVDEQHDVAMRIKRGELSGDYLVSEYSEDLGADKQNTIGKYTRLKI